MDVAGIRISRSIIVNAERIKELRRLLHSSYELILHNNARLTLSQRYRHKLKRLGFI